MRTKVQVRQEAQQRAGKKAGLIDLGGMCFEMSFCTILFKRRLLSNRRRKYTWVARFSACRAFVSEQPFRDTKGKHKHSVHARR